MRNKTLIIGALAGALMISGCAMLNQQIAMGPGPEAEEAVQRLEGQGSLEAVGMNGQNIKARKIAIGKLSNADRLHWFVGSRHVPGELRVAAFLQLVKLGKAQEMLDRENGTGLAPIVLLNGDGDKPDEMEFPLEWRLKAARCKYVDYRLCNHVVKDEKAPMALRLAAIESARLEKNDYAAILAKAGDASNAAHEDYGRLAKACLQTMEGDRLGEIFREKSLSLDAVKFVFPLVKGESALLSALEKVTWRAEDDNAVNGEQVAEYVIGAADQKILKKYVLNMSTKYSKYLTLAVNHINNDELLADVLGRKSLIDDAPETAWAALNKIKSEEIRQKFADFVTVKCAPDVQRRCAALERLFAKDSDMAYKMVKGLISGEVKTDVERAFDSLRFSDGKKKEKRVRGMDVLQSMTDVKTLGGLLAIAKAQDHDWDRLAGPIEKATQKALLGIVTNQFASLSEEQRAKLVKAVKAQGQKFEKEGKACVIGNCYVGMPLIGLMALNKVQEFQVLPDDFCVDTKKNRVIVSALMFTSKNLFKITGREKAEIRYTLQERFGLARFTLRKDKVEYQRNDLAEIMFGDFSQGKYTGLELCWQSETQAKNTRALFWEDKGTLVLSGLE